MFVCVYVFEFMNMMKAARWELLSMCDINHIFLMSDLHLVR